MKSKPGAIFIACIISLVTPLYFYAAEEAAKPIFGQAKALMTQAVIKTPKGLRFVAESYQLKLGEKVWCITGQNCEDGSLHVIMDAAFPAKEVPCYFSSCLVEKQKYLKSVVGKKENRTFLVPSLQELIWLATE